MNKRAQVTIYIIIGIVILFSIATAVYVAHRLLVSPEEIATVDRPIKDYVEACIQQVGEQALLPVGASGGYLDPGNPVLSGQDFFVSKDPAEGDALLVSELTGDFIPYWFYMSTGNDCKQCMMESMQPSIEQVKSQIDGYMEEHLEECIHSFEPFLEQGYIFETGDVQSDILLAEESTRFLVNYPVTAKKLDVTTKMENFVGVVDVPFKKMYDLAGRITKEEKEKAFLESFLFHFISLHTGLEMSKLPPLGGVTHDKILVNWFRPMVEMNVQQLLLSYIPLIQLYNTKDARQVSAGDNVFEEGFYKGLYLKFLKEKHPFNVNFMYLEWPFYFDITPRSGEILTGEAHIQEWPFNFATAFQTNYYEFYYDVSAPVMVEIRDPDALKGKGYSFNFALELNVRDNKDFVEWNRGEGTIGYWDSSKAGIETKDVETQTGVCSEQGSMWKCDISGRSYPGQVECVQNCYVSTSRRVPFKPVKKLFADENQKVSDTHIISVFDAVTKQGVNEVSILFTCGKYKTVILGGTDLRGRLKTKLPMCINGQLSFDKDGYAKKIIPLTVKPDDRKEIDVFMEPEAQVKATIKKYPIQIRNLRELEYSQEPEAQLSVSYAEIDSWEGLGMSALGGFQEVLNPISLSIHWEEEGYKVGKEQKNMKIYDRYCCDAPEKLNASYKAILMVEKIPEELLEPAYFQAMMLEKGVSEDVISLVPGLYKVTGMLIDVDGFVIEPGCQEICLEYDTGTEFYVEEIVGGVIDPLGAIPEEKPECKEWGYFPEEEIVAKPSLMGGVMLDNATGYWNVTRADLNKGAVEFYFIQTLKPTCTAVQDCVLDVCVDVGETQATNSYSAKYREYLEPVFSRQ